MSSLSSIKNEHKFWIFVIISILLHIILFMMIPLLQPIIDKPHELRSNSKNPPKLEFKLVKSNQKETDTPAEDAFESDRNSLASQEHPDLSLPEGNPQPPQELSPENKDYSMELPRTQQKSEMEETGNTFNPTAMEFWEQFQENKHRMEQEKVPETVKDLNKSAYRRGGFALNTYNWDYAPYMLALRDRIQNNIRPPMSFTRMGIGEGQNIIKFRINKSGKLESVQLLDSTTHETLDETSLRAIRYSFPFMKLPENFPEDYLEITGFFNYIIQRGHNARSN